MKVQRSISPNPPLAAAHSNLGTVLYQQGQFEDAILEYKRAISFDPEMA